MLIAKKEDGNNRSQKYTLNIVITANSAFEI